MTTHAKKSSPDLLDLAKSAGELSKPPPPSADEVAEILAKEAAERDDAVPSVIKAPDVPREAATPPPAKAPPMTPGTVIKDAPPPFAVRRGRIFKPRRTVIYGPGGVGKTTAVADVDGVLLFDLNNGSEMLDVPRYLFRPADELRGHIPLDLAEFVGGIRKVRQNPAGVKSIAIDTLGDLERLAMLHILKRDADAEGKEKLHSLESYGYGKGKQILFDQMRELLAELDKLTSVGLNVVIVAHSEVVKVNKPDTADYDRYIIKALNHPSASVSGYVFGWADEVGFMHHDDRSAKAGGKGKDKGVTGNKRVIEFDHSAAWDAKARLPLPRRIEVGSANPWSFMKLALDRAYRMGPADIRVEIDGELERIGDPELNPKVKIAVLNAGDNLDKLTAYMQELRRRPAMDQPGEAPAADLSED